MLRKILVYILLFILLAGAAGGYFYYQQNLNSKSDQADQDGLQSQAVSDRVVVSPVAHGNSEVYFGGIDGRVYRYGDGEAAYTELPIAPMPLASVGSIIWSPTGKDFIVTPQFSSRAGGYYYNSGSQQYAMLAKNVLDFDWLPDGMRIALVWQSGDQKSQQVVVSNGDGSGYRVVANLPSPEYKIRVSPSGGEALLISSKPAALENKIYLIDLDSGAYRVLVDQGNNLDAKWIDANSFVYLRFDKPYPRVFEYDITQGQAKDLGINTDLDRLGYNSASKQIVAAIRPLGTVVDKIVTVNPATGQAADYFAPDGLLVKNLIVSPAAVFYVNGADGRLYQIK